MNFSFADEFMFEGIAYGIEPLGNKLVVYQRSHEMTMRDVSGLQPIDCDKLEVSVAIKKQNFMSCHEEPDTAFCRLLRHDVQFMSDEKNFQSPHVPYNIWRRWALTPLKQPPSDASIITFAAKHFNVDRDRLMIRTPSKLENGPVKVEITTPSLLSSINMLLPHENGELDGPALKHGHLIANNRYFACDLARHRVSLLSSYQVTLTYDDRYDPTLVAQLWELYGQVANLMQKESFKSQPILLQSMLIGGEITAGLYRHKLHSHPTITLSSLVHTWFEELVSELTLKDFASLEQFKQTLYPDHSYTKDVEVTWRVQ